MFKFRPTVPLDQRLASFGLLGHAIRSRLFPFSRQGTVLGDGGDGVWWPGLWISTVLERVAEGAWAPRPIPSPIGRVLAQFISGQGVPSDSDGTPAFF